MKLHKKFEHNLPGVYFWGERSDVDIRVNVSKFRAGEKFPNDLLHYHKTRTTYFCILEGTLFVEVNKQEIILTSESMLEILPMEKYRTKGVGKKGCQFIVIGSHNEHDKVNVLN